jgi:hypothetical protein
MSKLGQLYQDSWYRSRLAQNSINFCNFLNIEILIVPHYIAIYCFKCPKLESSLNPSDHTGPSNAIPQNDPLFTPTPIRSRGQNILVCGPRISPAILLPYDMLHRVPHRLHTNLPDPVPSSTSSRVPVPRQQLYSMGTDRGRGLQSRHLLLSWGRTLV